MLQTFLLKHFFVSQAYKTIEERELLLLFKNEKKIEREKKECFFIHIIYKQKLLGRDLPFLEIEIEIEIYF